MPASNSENPVQVTKLSASLLKARDLVNNYVEYLPVNQTHFEFSPAGFVVLYWNQRAIATVFNDIPRNNGSSIFGATTASGVEDAIALIYK
jgi:filamentous hemagglutinin family protein